MSDEPLHNPDLAEDEDSADGEMSPKALTAFEQYYAMGPARSLRKLAAESGANLRVLERWSAAFEWPRLCRERHKEEIDAARAAAKKEAATLARRRMRNAQLMQEAALTILSKAKLTEMEPEDARKALGDARFLLVEGMKMERLELGEATETVSQAAPPKPVSEMSDEELEQYIQLLEQES